MNSHFNLPWREINDFLLNLENILETRKFHEILLNNLHQLIPYDQARIYEMDMNGKIVNAVIIEVDQWWNDAYIQYYSKISNNINRQINDNDKENYQKFSIVSWKDYESDEFVVDYIEPQGIKYTLALGLKNSDNIVLCGLDRIKGNKFSTKETNILDIVQPHLQNLYQNLPYYKCFHQTFNENLKEILTKREREIADLLVKGVTPSHIGEQLYISQTTVYRHIANIHSKLNVSNRQELLLKLMRF